MKTPEGKPTRLSATVRCLLISMGCALIVLSGIPSMAVSDLPKPELQPDSLVSSEQARILKDEYGIQLMSFRFTSAGYMLDFRYRIVDPDKAKFLMNKDLKPYIVDKETGSKFFVPSHPKIGSMRAVSDLPKPGRSYFILFSNTDGILKAGQTVSVVIGDLVIEDLAIPEHRAGQKRRLS